MKIKALEIGDAFKISPKSHQDSRGRFTRTFCTKEYKNNGLNTEWVQMNSSVSFVKGTVRGLHYQKPPYAEIKLVRCVRGRIFDVILDLRKDSLSYGVACSVELNSKTFDTIYIPKGCAHGFQALTNDTEIQYCHSAFYEPDYESGININDQELSIEWPLPLLNLSYKDKILPTFAETEPLVL